MATTAVLTTSEVQEGRIHAHSRHTFTLIFAHGQVALLEVRGSADWEQARVIAREAIAHCRYTVLDGDHTGGGAHYFYYWTRAAQFTS